MSATAAPSHLDTEPPCDAEIDAFMAEIEFTESCRRARQLVLERTCFFCFEQTLRLMHTGGRWALTCACGFRGGP